MLINDLPNNLLKILAGENGLPPLDPVFIKSLNLGQILTATVIKPFAKNQALIDLGGGQKTVSQTSSSVTVGQTVQVKAEQLGPTPVFKIIPDSKPPQLEDSLTINSPKDTGGRKAEPTRAIKLSGFEGSNQLNLKTGESVEAKVTALLPDSQVKAVIKGQEFVIRLPDNQVQAGDTLTLKSNGRNSFDLLLSSNSIAGETNTATVSTAMIKPYLLTKAALPQLAQNLVNLLETIPENFKIDPGQVVRLKEVLELLVPKEGPPPNADQIKSQVGTTAQSTENKLLKSLVSVETKNFEHATLELNKDFKAQLLLLKAGLESQVQLNNQRTEASSLLNAIKLTADNIELNQLSNQFSKQEGQAFVLQVPNPFSGQDKQIKIFVRNNQPEDESGKGKGKEKQNYNMVFLLNLSSLGSLEIDAKVSGGLVSIKFGTDNEAISHYIQSHVSELHAVLEGLGFSGSTECCVKKDKEIQFEDDFSDLMVNSSSKLVDIET